MQIDVLLIHGLADVTHMTQFARPLSPCNPAQSESKCRHGMQVYADDTNVDDELVESIASPAKDKAAAEVFYRVITANGTPVNQLLAELKSHRVPMLLLWGDLDPWIRPSSADRIQRLYPLAERYSVQAGHCPHDDTPQPVNKGLLAWLDRLPQQA